jgi:hypothetical protein
MIDALYARIRHTLSPRGERDPIRCARCERVSDGRGDWVDAETVGALPNAKRSICPRCLAEYYVLPQ